MLLCPSALLLCCCAAVSYGASSCRSRCGASAHTCGLTLQACRWFYFVIAIVSAILFTAYLIYDLQLLMGGRSNEFSPDAYVIAALNIYIDIIQIFLNVLQIIGILSD
jgi:FtsH-binding integral membrane protein